MVSASKGVPSDGRDVAAATHEITSSRVSGLTTRGGSAASDWTSDERLLAEFESGSKHAFQLIYRRYVEKLRAQAVSLVRHDQDAEDVVQEAFVRVLCRGSHFERKSSFYTWLYRIVFNLSMDRLRSATRCNVARDTIEIIAEQGSLPGAQPATDPYETCVVQETAQRIALALDGLSRHHRDVVVMRELHGMSYAEMADATGCSKGTIMSRLFHARQRLQAALRCVHCDTETHGTPIRAQSGVAGVPLRE